MPCYYGQFGIYRICEHCPFADNCEYEDLLRWDDSDGIYEYREDYYD